MCNKLLFLAVVLLGLSGCASLNAQDRRELDGTVQTGMNAVVHAAAAWDQIEDKRRACIDYGEDSIEGCAAKEAAAKRNFCSKQVAGYEDMCAVYRYRGSYYETPGAEQYASYNRPQRSYDDRRYYGRRTGSNNPPPTPKTPIRAKQEQEAAYYVKHNADAICMKRKNRPFLGNHPCDRWEMLGYRRLGGAAAVYRP